MNTRLLNSQPWRFLPGDTAFVRGWPLEDSVLITKQEAHRGFPHYLATDKHGAEWRISQLCLSSKSLGAL